MKDRDKKATLEEAEVAARKMASAMRDFCPRGWGYILFVQSSGPRGHCTYLSTIQRDDAIRSLKEWITHVQPGGPADAPGFVDRTADECWCCESKNDLVIIQGPLRSTVVCRRCLMTAARKETT